MTPKVKGGRVKSVKALKESVKKGGDYALKRIPANDSMTVRFLEEPDQWFQYKEYYDKEAQGYFPDFEGLDPDLVRDLDRPSKRYLAPVVDVMENKPYALVLPTSLVTSLLKRFEKYNTMLDRDYELIKEGEGLSTTYDAIPESPTKYDVRRIEIPDLGAALQASIPAEMGGSSDDDLDDDADDTDDEDEPIRSRRASKRATKGSTRTRRAEPEDDDDDETPVRRKRPIKKTPAASGKRPLRRR